MLYELRYIIILFSLLPVLHCRVNKVNGWTYKTTLGENITLVCNDTEVEEIFARSNFSITSFPRWEMPSGVVLKRGEMERDMEVSSDGRQLEIKGVSEVHNGIYKCHIVLESNVPGTLLYKVMRGLNVNGPIITSIWEQYEQQTELGAICAGSLTAFFICIGCIFAFRWRSPTGATSGNSTLQQKQHVVTTNAVFTPEVDEADDTKMADVCHVGVSASPAALDY